MSDQAPRNEHGVYWGGAGGGGAYYNEIDPFAAAWLRELIKAGEIAPGVVDERDIRDVVPDELAGYTQCHFFAGIGVWSYALRRAGWPDDRPIWTASCPCQPFSTAGRNGGFADDRHLWPTFNALRVAKRPVVAIGEQVASKDGLAWLDLVQTDVEASGDAFGAVDLCAAGFGAPHIRQRLFWLAHAHDARLEGRKRVPECADQRAVGTHSVAGRLGDADCDGREQGCEAAASAGHRRTADADGRTNDGHPLHTNGFWRDADWLLCRDIGGPRWRPVEPGTFPLADGAPESMGIIRGAGNAINAEVATAFISAVIGTLQHKDQAA